MAAVPVPLSMFCVPAAVISCSWPVLVVAACHVPCQVTAAAPRAAWTFDITPWLSISAAMCTPADISVSVPIPVPVSVSVAIPVPVPVSVSVPISVSVSAFVPGPVSAVAAPPVGPPLIIHQPAVAGPPLVIMVVLL